MPALTGVRALLVDTLLVLSVLGSLYMMLAAREVRRFRARPRPPQAPHPGITLLKPLAGDEAGLHASLASFLDAGDPDVQAIFGVRDRADPAAGIVDRLSKERPDREILLVVDSRVHGSNRKVSNLLNMLGAARNELVVVADSDIRVSPGYFEAVAAPFADAEVGLVTCLYVGKPEAGLWSRLGAMWVNYGFLPSVLVAERLGQNPGCFGATIALKRTTLDAIGGLFPLRDVLADDHALGAAVRASGGKVVLASYVVDMVVSEPSASALFAHEIRWLRTIRSVEPWGYAGLFVTHPLALSLLGLALAPWALLPIVTVLVALLSRRHLTVSVEQSFGLSAPGLGILALRDILSFGLFLGSFMGNRIAWRGRRFRVARGGTLVDDEGVT